MVIKPSDDFALLASLHTACFPDDRFEPDSTQYWVATHKGLAIAFASARLDTDQNICHLTRSGVTPPNRGQGIQRKLLKIREEWAFEHGAEFCVTYVSLGNWASLMNLLKTGYELAPYDEDMLPFVVLTKQLIEGAETPDLSRVVH